MRKTSGSENKEVLIIHHIKKSTSKAFRRFFLLNSGKTDYSIFDKTTFVLNICKK